jgi:hypothetical protein
MFRHLLAALLAAVTVTATHAEADLSCVKEAGARLGKAR